MKKVFVLLTLIFAGIVLVACATTTLTTATTPTTGSSVTTTETPTTTTTTTTTEEPVVLGNKVIVHYNKTLRAVEEFNVKAWGKDLQGNFPVEENYYTAFDGEDSYGVYATIDLVAEERSTIGLEVRLGADGLLDTASIPTVDLTLCNASLEVHVYLVSGAETVNYTTPATGIEKLDIDIRYIPVVDRTTVVSEIKFTFDNYERPVLAKTGVVTTGNAALSDRESHLMVNYSTTSGITPNDAIYKGALGQNTSGAYTYLVLVMKGSNGALINELNLGFRLDDNHEVLSVPFEELLDPDLAALPELTGEYQTYVIDIANTLDGKTFEGTGVNPDTPAAGSMVGFHLMSDGTGTGTIEIKEVYYTSTSSTLGYSETTDFLIDNFQRSNVNTAPAGIYWCGSVGEIVGKWLILDATGASVTYEDSSMSIADYENIVISLRAAAAGQDITVTPVYKTGETVTYGTPALLSTLKNNEGEVIGTLGTAFAEVTINLAENAWAVTNMMGIKFELSTGVVTIDTIEYKTFVAVAAPEYPQLDSESVKVWDGFNRAAVGATSAYDASNPVALTNNLYYIISYTDSEVAGKLYIENNAVVFDCTEDTGYINFVEASKSGNAGEYQYVVFKLKVDEGGNLGNFRFQTGTGSVIYSSAFLAAPGLSSLTSPYVDNDGWTYVVIDLALSGFLTSFEEMTLFYSDGGRLLIDNVFFANNDYTRLNLEDRTVVDTFDGTKIFTIGPDYAYNWVGFSAANPLNQRYLVFLIKGTSLNDFRFQTDVDTVPSDAKWLKDGALIGLDGYKYVVEDIPGTEYAYLAIDLEASGLQLNPEGIHLHLSGNAKVYIAEIFFADAMVPTAELAKYEPATPQVIDGSASGYLYNYIALNHASNADYLVLVVKGSLESIRFQTISGINASSAVVYLNQMIGFNGQPLEYEANSTEYQTLIIDLAASGLGTNVGALHFHYADDTATDILTIQKMYLLANKDVNVINDATKVDIYPLETPRVIDASAEAYVYTGIDFTTPITGQRLLVLSVKGELNWVRFELFKGLDKQPQKSLTDLIGIDGKPLVFPEVASDPVTLVIDLVASGLSTDLSGMHLHYGEATSSTDILTVYNISVADRIDPTLALAAAIAD